MNEVVYAATAALLLAFTGVAAADGLYLHLHRLRLHRLAACRREHRLHTANAVLFPPLTALLFCAAPRGLWLWLAAGLFAATFAVEIADVRCEYQSRAGLGGLSAHEYLLHFLMSALRTGAVVPLLVLPPAAAWSISQTGLDARPAWFAVLGACIAVPGLGTAALHLWLARAR